MHLEIPNNIINYININMSEEVNVKARKILPMAHQFLSNDILLFTSRKHTDLVFGKVVSLYGLLDTLFGNFINFILIQRESSVIIICTYPGVLNAFYGKLRVALGGAVENNMVSTLSHLSNIGLK